MIGKQIFICMCAMTLTMPTCAQIVSTDEVPKGWKYVDGDEFNARKLNYSYWGTYGDKYTRNELYGQNNDNQCMAQTYRAEQISLVKGDNDDNRLMRITATRDDNPPTPRFATDKMGWWSGFLSSRDAKNYNGNSAKYYPLFSRIEMRAKVPYQYGVWAGLWMRHYQGAGMLEIDLQEFFVKWNKEHDPDVPYKINQSIHGNDNTTGKVRYNLNRESDRISALDFDPGSDFHVYGVQVDPDLDDADHHAVISFLIDGRVRSVWKSIDYGDKYNKFMSDAVKKGHENATWDIAINGGIGGANGASGIGYPEDNPEFAGNKDLVPHNYEMDVDWVRAFQRTNKPLWFGEIAYTGNAPEKGAYVTIPAGRFAQAEVGDKITIDLKCSGGDKYPYLDLCDDKGKSLGLQKLDITQGDARVQITIDNADALALLRTNGCTLYGNGITVFALSLNKKDGTAWNGDKKIKWGEVIVGPEAFEGIAAGDVISLKVCDVKANAKCYLRQNIKEEGQKDRPNMPSDVQYGHILRLAEGDTEVTYEFTVNAEAAKTLAAHGLAVTGTEYNLTEVRVIRLHTDAIRPVHMSVGGEETNQPVYGINGTKVGDHGAYAKKAPGIYVVGHKKILVK
jgi:hypothetical protein